MVRLAFQKVILTAAWRAVARSLEAGKESRVIVTVETRGEERLK